MNTANRMRNLVRLGLGIGYGVVGYSACAPSVGPGGAQSPSAKAAPPVQAELHAASPAAQASAAPSAQPVGAPFLQAASVEPEGPLSCVHATDPELDKESSWSRELGGLIQRQLPKLRDCSLGMASDDEGQITLRLVYDKNGSPVSQHVVTSTSSACAVSECLKRGLSTVKAPELLIEQASIDVTLSLAHGAVPTRVNEPVDPLTPEEPRVNADSCVDQEIAKLSQATVREVVSTTYNQLEACYGQALTRDHSASGKVTFEFVIDRDGKVSQAWASDATLRDCGAIDCMLSQFRELNFPEPVGRSMRVIYPISYVLEQNPMVLR